jgi:hypothetical protein
MAEKPIGQENEATFNTVFKLLNYMGNDKALTAVFAENLPREHRTLQQNFMRMLQHIIYSYADVSDVHGSDLRNEAATKWAQAVKMLQQVPELRYKSADEKARFVDKLCELMGHSDAMPFV